MAKARAACSSPRWRAIARTRWAGSAAAISGSWTRNRTPACWPKMRNLAAQRGELANWVALVQRRADAAKGDDKKELAAMAAAGGALSGVCGAHA